MDDFRIVDEEILDLQQVPLFFSKIPHFYADTFVGSRRYLRWPTKIPSMANAGIYVFGRYLVDFLPGSEVEVELGPEGEVVAVASFVAIALVGAMRTQTAVLGVGGEKEGEGEYASCL